MSNVSSKKLGEMEEDHVRRIRKTLNKLGINPDENFFTSPEYEGTSSGTVGFPTRTGITSQTIMDFISEDKERRSKAKTIIKNLYENDLKKYHAFLKERGLPIEDYEVFLATFQIDPPRKDPSRKGGKTKRRKTKKNTKRKRRTRKH
jgi:hypothetical protein